MKSGSVSFFPTFPVILIVRLWLVFEFREIHIIKENKWKYEIV